ncbi:hypothetical protein GLAREA_02124 [Glarea lozoyensis ATCC 20868]|uniref:Uncharacterized protein n=1 Tax=Glarea lozoyensis (strain ATCC 20868 / MF5171) TaxID=1116229 RepID=S3CI99_GLAL2|nr:uncharacterized protein GLAREA_02124 [Glarea lozoyensis ATCC 20868]EPE26212.1 hypothetical protein GLAREA_02124 [Glarea lozoyensis ATCC 20868]
MSDNHNQSTSSPGRDGTQFQGPQQPGTTDSSNSPETPETITLEQTTLSHHAEYYKDVQPLTSEEFDRLMLTPANFRRIINTFIARSNYIQAKLIDNDYEPSIATPPGGPRLEERIEYARKYRALRDALPTYTANTHELVDPPLFHGENDKDEVEYEEWVAAMRNKMNVNSEIFVNEEIKMAYTRSRLAGSAFKLMMDQAYFRQKRPFESAEEILRQASLWC